MNSEPANQTEANPNEIAKPEPETAYWVKCDGYRTRAVYSQDGKWRAVSDGKEVENVREFFP